jgi:hypothetical protein
MALVEHGVGMGTPLFALSLLVWATWFHMWALWRGYD